MMASLAAFVDAKTRAGVPVKFVPPSNRDVRYYLSRMGMASFLETAGIAHGLPVVNSNMALTERALVEVRAFSSDAEVESLIAIVNYQSVADDLQRSVSRALLEAGCNVPEHARVNCGFMAAQVLNSGRMLRLAVADAGVGVFTTLKGAGAETEKEALMMAATGTSETGLEEKGRGLTSIHESIKRHGGRGALISGQSLVRMNPNNLQAWTGNAGSYQGTILDVVLPIR
jgi:hypothetical protein